MTTRPHDRPSDGMGAADAANGEPGASEPLNDASMTPDPGTARSDTPSAPHRVATTRVTTEEQHMADTTTDALEQLEQEHRAVEQLLHDLAESEEGTRREQLVDELTSALQDHMAFEERQVYPIVREVLGEEDAEEGEIEHDLTRDGLAKLSALVSEPGFGAVVAMVTAGVGHHVEEEEHEVFPRLRQEAAEAVGELRRDASAPPDGSDGPTRDELYEAAQEADIPGRSSMTKDELARALAEQGIGEQGIGEQGIGTRSA